MSRRESNRIILPKGIRRIPYYDNLIRLTKEQSDRLSAQIDRLAKVVLDEFGGPDESIGACDMAIKLLRKLATENKKLQQAILDKAGQMCAYCGVLYDIKNPNRMTLIQEHMKICEKHPMRALAAENERLRKRVEELEKELEKAYLTIAEYNRTQSSDE